MRAGVQVLPLARQAARVEKPRKDDAAGSLVRSMVKASAFDLYLDANDLV